MSIPKWFLISNNPSPESLITLSKWLFKWEEFKVFHKSLQLVKLRKVSAPSIYYNILMTSKISSKQLGKLKMVLSSQSAPQLLVVPHHMMSYISWMVWPLTKTWSVLEVLWHTPLCLVFGYCCNNWNGKWERLERFKKINDKVMEDGQTDR